ncbi:discoidin domain-containing protein [Actinosynnema sp. NPDC050801]|uniref:discoidin domain-containing protein n=1 Tax=unclassified Actinosynnema TaxID=2637065 RepID=UPI0033D5E321
MSTTTRAGSRLAASLLALSLTAFTLSPPAAQAAPSAGVLDLGTPTRIDQVRLSLPDDESTFAVQTSLDGKGFATLVPSARREGDRQTFDFDPTLVRYVRVDGAQVQDIDVREAVDAQLAATYSASSHNDVYQASNAGDANQASYWESANNAFPQWLRADLGAAIKVDRVVLKLPTAGWGARTQTLAVQHSTDGQNFGDLVPSAQYAFNPTANNTVTIQFTATTTRYVRLLITGNSAWPAGQVSEFELHGPTGGDTQAPSAPTNLAHSSPQSGQIRLTWSASTDNTGVTGYDIYANGALRTSVAGTVLAHTDSQPDGVAVTYHVIARDAAGNQSPPSNSVTRPGSPGNGTNLAKGRPITASSHTFTFVAANANDDDVNTYWEGATYPNTLTTQLGSNADLSSVLLKLNPSSAWGTRTQNVQVLGREQSASGFTNLVSARDYVFNPATGNTVTIPLTARVADVQLRITSNSGAPGGQVAELQVFGVAAPNPDLTVTATSFTPTSPVETSPITLSATVRNAGTATSGATDVTFFLGNDAVGTAQVGALAAGASATATAAIGPRGSGSYQYTAKVDETKKVVEQNEANNARLHPSALVITPVPSSDLVGALSWSPTNPANGQNTTFTVVLRNEGSIATASGAHGVTLTLADATTGATVRTFSGSHTGTIQPGQSAAPITLGTWPAANGKYTLRTAVAVDANEIAARQGNNVSTQSLFVGRGANVPWEHIEAEDAVTAGGAQKIGPNRTIGDLAGEASGRRAVTLNSTGSSVEFTTNGSTNTLVTRFSIPDSAGGGGIGATLNVYVNGSFHKAIDLHSRHIWLYGNEAAPGNSPGAGPRHIYDEANVTLNATFPAGTKIKLQKDAANTTNYAIDFVNFENAVARANPDPARYITPTGFGHQDVQNALDRFRMDTSGNLLGVYLPSGTYTTSQKFQVYGKPIRVIGAGPWFTRFVVPTTQENTDAGFRAEQSVNGSTFSGFAFFGNYTSRIDGPGKVFDFANVANITIENIWAEHMVCLYWGANTDFMTIKDSRIRNMFADGINMTNGSTDNRVANIEARSTGDDSFALFSAIDAGGADEKNNVYENLSSLTTWRAAGLAVYGGFLNTFRNIYIADTLTYSGVTISSLDFGYPMNGFGPEPTTFSGLTLVRTGGHFWNGQTFPGIWMFSASKPFRGIRVNDVDIIDPTYSGIMFQTKYTGSTPENPIQDTVLTNISISGARLSGDQFEHKSGIGVWANEMPEAGQGPAVGSATFNNLRFSNNAENIRNRTSTFTITINP